MSTITLWLAFYFVLFSEHTFLLLLVIQLKVEYKIEYEYFILVFFSRGYLCASLLFLGREREKIQSDISIIIKIGHSVCCLKLELAFNTSLKHFVLTKSVCWLAFERKTKNIMLCVLPLCIQLVIFE